MRIYKSIYPFEVLDYIKAGETVYMLDRDTNEVLEVNSREVGEFAEVLKFDNETKRYDFWIEETKKA